MKNDKKLFGICKIGERGQIVIPKDARDMFELKPGDSLILLGDRKKGMALVKAEILEDFTEKTLGEINGNQSK